MTIKTHLRLGDLLVSAGLITESQLKEAINRQKTSHERLGEALVSLRYVTEVQLAEVLGRQLGIPFKNFEKGDLQWTDSALKKILPEEFIRKQLVLPLAKGRDAITIALFDPLDLILLDNLKKMTGQSIAPVIATKTDMLKAIEAAFGKRDLLKEAVAGTYGQSAVGAAMETVEEVRQEEGQTVEDLTAKAGEAQVVRLVDLFLTEAVNSRASDIHIEPYPNQISIRFRIDGILQPVEPPAAHLMPAIISRIKILSRMDIAEKRLPQDGGFTIRLGEKVVDLRVSTIPVVYGEKVVIRLLDKSNLVFDFKQLGMGGQALQDVEQGITSPYGLIFITGPTGSGKSTTLYAAINRIKSPARNVVTIEDPVEYKVEGINQVQAKPAIGLTFAAGLRAFLRQDPDVIMVGEVRDLETAGICVQAALTGHLVLSTLHTNDAASAVTRLIDLGVEPFLLAPSLVLLVAQRLIRKLCPKCKQPYDPPSGLKEKTKLPAGQYFKANGCPDCRNTGYAGRLGIYEVMRVEDRLRDLISKGSPAEEIKKLAQGQGMKSLFESGLEKAAQGLTSLEEAFSVTVGALAL
ncbi:MAG: Flp pilus assembly complex ATPase component TadA [Candidatus Omnitrophica bacterium]|nr:Flp pilus assembly complex ATPase component TadA [Candidatus Omnitrophota bacterium]